ncbi:hypothetical protein OG884_33175 [Streptosporangium sp. NBC_01755]|uniref:hypothetical protein n=1 Tax=unclassified Streptosporangium TaxID=2632669 RepID=UPI002DD988FE|nr:MULTISPECIES: hypothetical protein [unclassified Streptosporangium]WSA28933.1 hypothetical protein OIE13_14315 [Streptosporangium sp. NBC_01810]WSC99620.1 hypothetical protein OG884_33175 [Streptosporangium sp. NBC_01755]
MNSLRERAFLNRLDELRGPMPSRPHDARAIAALAANPGCARRAVMDAAGVDKDRTARRVGFPAPFGQSQFAITRGNVFEALVKENGCAELLRLLRELLGLSVAQVGYRDVESVGSHLRHSHTRALIDRAAREDDGTAVFYDHPLFSLEIAGHTSYLEPDVVAFQIGGRFHIVEIKSFGMIDGQAEPDKVAAAARQAAVYVLALRTLMADLGHDPERVSHDVVLVCPENFANHPTAALVDVRKQLSVLGRQLTRMTRVEYLLEGLPDGLTFDLAPGEDGVPTRSVDELAQALLSVPARYAPDCLSTCDMCMFCRHEARACGSTDLLGRQIRDQLGGVSGMHEALGLAEGTREAAEGQEEIARLLRLADRLREESLR